MEKIVVCIKDGEFLFEGTPTEARTQVVFRCPLHNEILILPSGYHWRFVKVLKEGTPTPQYLPWNRRLHRKYKSFTLSYPKGSQLGRVGVNLGQLEPYSGTFIASILPVEARIAEMEARAIEVEARAVEIEAKAIEIEAARAIAEAVPAKAITLSDKLKKYAPWALFALAIA